MNYKILIVMIILITLIGVVSAIDEELYIFQIGDEELYIQPVISDEEINIIYVSQEAAAPAQNGTNTSSSGIADVRIYEEVKVKVVSSENVIGGDVIAEVNITNRRSYSVTDVVLTSYLSDIDGNKYSETRAIFDEIEPGVTSFHQNLTIPSNFSTGGYRFNVIYEKLTFSGQGAKVIFKAESFDIFEVTQALFRPLTVTIILTLIGLIGVILFMYFFDRRMKRMEAIVIPDEDEEDEDEQTLRDRRRKNARKKNKVSKMRRKNAKR